MKLNSLVLRLLMIATPATCLVLPATLRAENAVPAPLRSAIVTTRGEFHTECRNAEVTVSDARVLLNATYATDKSIRAALDASWKKKRESLPPAELDTVVSIVREFWASDDVMAARRAIIDGPADVIAAAEVRARSLEQRPGEVAGLRIAMAEWSERHEEFQFHMDSLLQHATVVADARRDFNKGAMNADQLAAKESEESDKRSIVSGMIKSLTAPRGFAVLEAAQKNAFDTVPAPDGLPVEGTRLEIAFLRHQESGNAFLKELHRAREARARFEFLVDVLSPTAPKQIQVLTVPEDLQKLLGLKETVIPQGLNLSEATLRTARAEAWLTLETMLAADRRAMMQSARFAAARSALSEMEREEIAGVWPDRKFPKVDARVQPLADAWDVLSPWMGMKPGAHRPACVEELIDGQAKRRSEKALLLLARGYEALGCPEEAKRLTAILDAPGFDPLGDLLTGRNTGDGIQAELAAEILQESRNLAFPHGEPATVVVEASELSGLKPIVGEENQPARKLWSAREVELQLAEAGLTPKELGRRIILLQIQRVEVVLARPMVSVK